MASIIADKTYDHLDQQHLLTGDQRECRKRSRVTNKLLYIEREIITEVTPSRKQLSNDKDTLYKSLYGSSFLDSIVFKYNWKKRAQYIKTLFVTSMEILESDVVCRELENRRS